MMKPIPFFMLFLSALSALAQTSTPKPANHILLNNVQIFNGKDEKTITGNVLIVNNLISKISTAPIPTDKSANVQIVDGKGKFLMPGLIDAHTHMMFAAIPNLWRKKVFGGACSHSLKMKMPVR